MALELPGFTAVGARMKDKTAAKELQTACRGGSAVVKQAQRKEKSEKPPALYDLTTLQRDANRLLGFTAQQTLDYLQNLYEKKLCTYPRTDSRYLTSDMAEGLPVLVNLTANAMPFRKGIGITCNPEAVINDKKVTDHHAVIPTRNLRDADLSALLWGKSGVGAGGRKAAVRGGGTPSLRGNRRHAGLRRSGVCRKGKTIQRPAGAGWMPLITPV